MLLPRAVPDTLLFRSVLGSFIVGARLSVVLVPPLLLLSVLLGLLVPVLPFLLLGVLLGLLVPVLPLLLLSALWLLLLLLGLTLLLSMLLLWLGLFVLVLLLRMVLLFALLLALGVRRSSDSEKQRQYGCAGDSKYFHR